MSIKENSTPSTLIRHYCKLCEAQWVNQGKRNWWDCIPHLPWLWRRGSENVSRKYGKHCDFRGIGGAGAPVHHLVWHLASAKLCHPCLTKRACNVSLNRIWWWKLKVEACRDTHLSREWRWIETNEKDLDQRRSLIDSDWQKLVWNWWVWKSSRQGIEDLYEYAVSARQYLGVGSSK